MDKGKELLFAMDSLLDQLIAIAKEIETLSKHHVVEEKLEELQVEQEILIKGLMKLNRALNKLPEDQRGKRTKIRKIVNIKLEKFSSLNAEFLENIRDVHGLINFRGK